MSTGTAHDFDEVGDKVGLPGPPGDFYMERAAETDSYIEASSKTDYD